MEARSGDRKDVGSALHLLKGGRTTPRGRSEGPVGSIVSEMLGSLTVFVSLQPFFP